MPRRSRSENYQVEITSSQEKKESIRISLLYSSPQFFCVLILFIIISKKYHKNLTLLPRK